MYILFCESNIQICAMTKEVNKKLSVPYTITNNVEPTIQCHCLAKPSQFVIHMILMNIHSGWGGRHAIRNGGFEGMISSKAMTFKM